MNGYGSEHVEERDDFAPEYRGETAPPAENPVTTDNLIRDNVPPEGSVNTSSFSGSDNRNRALEHDPDFFDESPGDIKPAAAETPDPSLEIEDTGTGQQEAFSGAHDQATEVEAESENHPAAAEYSTDETVEAGGENVERVAGKLATEATVDDTEGEAQEARHTAERLEGTNGPPAAAEHPEGAPERPAATGMRTYSAFNCGVIPVDPVERAKIQTEHIKIAAQQAAPKGIIDHINAGGRAEAAEVAFRTETWFRKTPNTPAARAAILDKHISPGLKGVEELTTMMGQKNSVLDQVKTKDGSPVFVRQLLANRLGQAIREQNQQIAGASSPDAATQAVATRDRLSSALSWLTLQPYWSS